MNLENMENISPKRRDLNGCAQLSVNFTLTDIPISSIDRIRRIARNPLDPVAPTGFIRTSIDP